MKFRMRPNLIHFLYMYNYKCLPVFSCFRDPPPFIYLCHPLSLVLRRICPLWGPFLILSEAQTRVLRLDYCLPSICLIRNYVWCFVVTFRWGRSWLSKLFNTVERFITKKSWASSLTLISQQKGNTIFSLWPDSCWKVRCMLQTSKSTPI